MAISGMRICHWSLLPPQRSQTIVSCCANLTLRLQTTSNMWIAPKHTSDNQVTWSVCKTECRVLALSVDNLKNSLACFPTSQYNTWKNMDNLPFWGMLVCIRHIQTQELDKGMLDHFHSSFANSHYHSQSLATRQARFSWNTAIISATTIPTGTQPQFPVHAPTQDMHWTTNKSNWV